MNRLRDEEQGAVLVIVAISLLALLGMVVLTFDLGRGVAIKRNMVNAADAGALAAARECGLANGTGAAQTAATQLIVDNNADATLTNIDFDSEPQCSGVASNGERQVTVTVTVPQEYYFAQIFGVDSGTVTASATAEWTLGDTSPAPLKIDQVKVEECLDEGVPDSEGRVDCYFTYEKDPALGAQDRGWLNLPEGWPIKDQDTNPMKCTSQKGGEHDLDDYIGTMGGMGTPGKQFSAGLWDPTGGGNPPTYVCGASGNKSPEAMNEWVRSVEQAIAAGNLESEPAVLFPVVAGEVKFTPNVAYPVVRLQGFYVKEAWRGQDARRQANCHFTGNSSDVFCIHLQTTGTDQLTTGGSVKVWLVD